MKTTEIQHFFRGKKITVMGLGLLGRGIQLIQFLAEQGADLTVTDLKTKEVLAPSLKKLSKYKNIRYVLGEHRVEDFTKADMVFRAPNAPLSSVHLLSAREAGVPVEMDASLFAKLVPQGVTLVGVTGTRGKSTVAQLIYEILDGAKRRVFLGGNVRNGVTLPLLRKVKAGDVVVLELDSWQLQGFGDAKLSPHISVFTSFMPDHLNYYAGDMKRYFADKSNIYRFQKKSDHLVVGSSLLKEKGIVTLASVHKVSSKAVPATLKLSLLGAHNRENVGLAFEVAQILRVPQKITEKVAKSFKGLPGRLEVLGKKKGIMFMNDTNGTSPEAVLGALEALKAYSRKIILVGGGADKELAYEEWAKQVKKHTKGIILFKGKASEKMVTVLGATKKLLTDSADSMKSAMVLALAHAKRGDVVLLSPGAASFGVFKNEYDRGDQFTAFFKKLSA